MAVAFAGFKAYNKAMAPLIAERDKAKEVGNQERLEEPRAKGRALAKNGSWWAYGWRLRYFTD